MLDQMQTMQSLFEQLGLPSDDASIEQFIATHCIPDGVRMFDADFWSPAQANFIKQGLTQDNEWAIVIDELNTRLRPKPQV